MVGQLWHRDEELHAVDDLVNELNAGRPRVLVFRGERGTGRTALLRAAALRTHETATVLPASCHPTERDYPFAMVNQLFSRPAHTPDQVPADGTGAVHGVLNNLFQATRSMAMTRPLVIAIDDIGAADPQSLQWCAYLARRLGGLPVAMILTATDLDPAGDELIRALESLEYARVITPRPLCGHCVGGVLEERYGVPIHERFVQACQNVARGNPSVLNTLARRLMEAEVAPDEAGATEMCEITAATLSETTLRWLDDRDPDTLRLAEALAILGRDGDLETAAMLWGKGELYAGQARTMLVRAGLIEPVGRDRFVHSVVREAVLTQHGPERRAELHARAASLLDRLGAAPQQTARHLMSASPANQQWVISLLRRAAQEATVEGDWPQASRYLRRALAEHDDPGQSLVQLLMAELGAAELHQSLPRGTRHIHSALRLGQQLDCRDTTLVTVANAAFTVAAPVSAVIFTDAAKQRARELTDTRRTASIGGEQFTRDRDELLATAAQALVAGQPAGTRLAVRFAAQMPASAVAGPLTAAVAVATAASGRTRARVARLLARTNAHATAGDCPAGSSCLPLIALAHAWAGRLTEAQRWARSAVSMARHRCSLLEEAFALLTASDIAFRQGHLDRALDRATSAMQQARQCGADDLLAASAAAAARVRLEYDEIDTARLLLHQHPSTPTMHPLLWATYTITAGTLATADGRDNEALRLFLEAGRRLTAHGIANPACAPWRSLAAARYTSLGQVDAARELIAQEVRLARRWGEPGSLGSGLSVAARLGGQPSVHDLHVRAVDLLAATEMRLEHARALLRQGAAEQSVGDTAAARETFGRALDVAVTCGAVRLSTEIRSRVRGDGRRLQPRAAAGRPTLTAGERRVAELVVCGMTNLEVANALSISKRTVDTHLAHAYRRLGIRNRAGLAAILNRPSEAAANAKEALR
jgi:DNA-binding CsgD family transcriptional regulator